jgi:hypothetical protein
MITSLKLNLKLENEKISINKNIIIKLDDFNEKDAQKLLNFIYLYAEQIQIRKKSE